MATKAYEREISMDYHCNWCGYDFFEEEGYNAEFDLVSCPNCIALRFGDEDDDVITKRKGEGK